MRFRTWHWLSLLIALTVIAAACADDADDDVAADPDDEEDVEDIDAEEELEDPYFEGEVLEFVIPLGEGGGSDVAGRFIASELAPHIPGEPDIQPLNITGGGGIVGANEWHNLYDRDGLSVFLSRGSTHIAEQLEDPAVEYDPSEWTPILSSPSGAVTYTTPEIGIEDPTELADLDHTFHYAGVAPVEAAYTMHLLAYDVLGLDVESTWGYDGAGETRVAFERGESDLNWQTHAAYNENVVPLIEQGSALPLFATGQLEGGELVRDPAQPDLMHPGELYEEMFGEEPSGEEWEAFKDLVGTIYASSITVWTHADAPQEAIDQLRQGAAAMVESEGFFDRQQDALGEYELTVDPEELDSDEWREAKDLDPATIEFLEQYLLEEFDVDLRE